MRCEDDGKLDLEKECFLSNTYIIAKPRALNDFLCFCLTPFSLQCVTSKLPWLVVQVRIKRVWFILFYVFSQTRMFADGFGVLL